MINLFHIEIPKFPAIQRKYVKGKVKEIKLDELQKYTKIVDILLLDESTPLFERFFEALLQTMKGLSQKWDLPEQIKEDAGPIEFLIKGFGRFFFGEIGNFKVALWVTNAFDGLITSEIEKGLTHFPNTKCVVSVGLAFAFDSTCKRGDIIISDCIDGVKTVEYRRDRRGTPKLSFCPDETRFTPVPKDLNSLFNEDWKGIICTKQRQRKSKVKTGTIMALSHENFRQCDTFDLSRNKKTYLGAVPGGISLLEAAKGCSKEVITINGVILYAQELRYIRTFKWLPTAAESVAQYLTSMLEKSSLSHPFFSG